MRSAHSCGGGAESLCISWARYREPSSVAEMIQFIVILLVIWLVLSILGFVIEGLFWLAVVGIVLFLATGIFGWLKRKTTS